MPFNEFENNTNRIGSIQKSTFDHLNTSNHPDLHSNDNGTSFLTKIFDLIINESKIVGNPDWVEKHNPKVINFEQPKQLEKILNLKILKSPMNEEELLDLCRKTIQYSVKTNHPQFANQLYGGVSESSLAGCWLTDSLNTSQATYETSPVFTLMEREAIKFLSSKCGWSTADGIFCPGGSLSNMYSLMLARHTKFPQIKLKGLCSIDRQLVIFCSDNSHYSYVKGAIFSGLGLDSVIKVPTDDKGCMNPQELRRLILEAIDQGHVPMMVGATSGTTVLCAYDPLVAIHEVCKEFNLWMHVDGSLGAGALLSSSHRHLLDGIQFADSITWNLHKMAGVSMQCSAFMTQHPETLTDALGLKAEYLFQSDKYYDASYDTGDKSLLCGRKVDSLKLWLHLAAHGEQQLADQVDHVFYMAKYATELIRKHPRMQLVLPSYQGNCVCFWYIPKDLEQIKDKTERERFLHSVCPSIKGIMAKRGNIFVNYQPLSSKKLPNFFRLVFTCVPEVTEQHVQDFLNEIDYIGLQLYGQ